MIYHEHYYKFFKTSWGILVGFKGRIGEVDETSDVDGFLKISDFVYMKLTVPRENRIIYENLFKIVNGIFWVSPHFTSRNKIILIIEQIDFDFQNFQVEGLFFGVADWLCSYYKIELPAYSAEYKKASNKYSFFFEDTDLEFRKLLYGQQ